MKSKVEARIFGLTSEQVSGWRGTVRVLVLTGRPHKRLDDLGVAVAGEHAGAAFSAVFLHDWPARRYEEVYGLLARRLKRRFPRAEQRDTFVAFLAHTALHEIGHARHMRGGSVLDEARAESIAEDYAWAQMERRFSDEAVGRAFGVFCATSLDR